MIKKPQHAVMVVVTENSWDAYGTPSPKTIPTYKLLAKEGISDSVAPGTYYFWTTWSIKKPLHLQMHLVNESDCF